MLRYAPAPRLRLRLSSFQPLINHHILPPAMRINKNKMKKVIHYDGEQNLNKTNKWREWKQAVIAYYWLFGSSIWEAVAEIAMGDIQQHLDMRKTLTIRVTCWDICFSYHWYEQLYSMSPVSFVPPILCFCEYILSDICNSSSSSPHLISGENLLSLLPPSQDQQSGSWVCSFGDKCGWRLLHVRIINRWTL